MAEYDSTAEQLTRRLERARVAKRKILADLLGRQAYSEEKATPLQRAAALNHSFDPPLKFVLAGLPSRARKHYSGLQRNVNLLKGKAGKISIPRHQMDCTRRLLLAEHELHQQTRRLMDSWRGRYTEHIASPKWRDFRRRILAERGGRCEDCSAPHSLQVHHLTYARMGNELPEDVRLLCVPCHAKRH